MRKGTAGPGKNDTSTLESVVNHLNRMTHIPTVQRQSAWCLLLLSLCLSPLPALAQPACGEFVPYHIRDSVWDDYRMYCSVRIRGLLDDGTRAMISVEGETLGWQGTQWDFRMSRVWPANNACASSATEFGEWAAEMLNGQWSGPGDQQWWVLERLESACGRNRSCEGAGAPTVNIVETGPDDLFINFFLERGAEFELTYHQERHGWELLDVFGETTSCREEGQLRTFAGYLTRLLATPGCDVASPYEGADDLAMQAMVDRFGEICWN